MRAPAWIAPPLEELPAPKFAYLASSWRSCAPSWHQDATTSPKISKKTPTWSQHLPTELPKPSQDSLQDPPEEAPTPKTPPKVMECWSFLHFSHFSKDREKSNQKCSQDPPKSCQTEPKMAILAPSWPILGATCCQLGPSCVHLGPIFAPTSPKISTKSSRSAPRHPKTTQGVARGLQDSPWSLNFHGFGVDFGLHLQIYFKGFDALCDPMLNPSSKPQVWHGGGFARAAH